MSKILIIGNGFDLSLGLKTSYSDFISSNEFEDLLKIEDVTPPESNSDYDKKIKCKKNSLAHYLKKLHTIDRWVDIENSLKKYRKEPANIYDHFSDDNKRSYESMTDKKDFIEVKKALGNYISKIEKEHEILNGKVQDQPEAVKLIYQGGLGNSVKNETYKTYRYFSDIYSFNYTNSITKIFSYLVKNTESWQAQPKWAFKPELKIHGDVTNLIFGIDDEALRNNDIVQIEQFFLKSDHPDFGKISIAKAIENVKEIHFFGLSFGETDNEHFVPLFDFLLNKFSSNDTNKKQLYFYVHGVKGYENLRMRLLALTNFKLAALKLKHSVYFYDTLGRCDVDSDWLNQKYLRPGLNLNLTYT